MTIDRKYIYVRGNTMWDTHNVFKLVRTSNIPDRDSQYATGELDRGYFEAVF